MGKCTMLNNSCYRVYQKMLDGKMPTLCAMGNRTMLNCCCYCMYWDRYTMLGGKCTMFNNSYIACIWKTTLCSTEKNHYAQKNIGKLRCVQYNNSCQQLLVHVLGKQHYARRKCTRGLCLIIVVIACINTCMFRLYAALCRIMTVARFEKFTLCSEPDVVF